MIRVEALTKVYGSGPSAVTVLDGVDFAVERGEVFAVVGASGAGKSTLAHCLNLLERPTSGSVTVNGVELSRLRERDLRAARRAIGTVFQSSSLLSRSTAAENVALPLDYLGVTPAERDARVAELLERVGLSHRADHHPFQLSGGQRQRVGIARALALRPSVLLADEATSGLDPESTRSVLSLLRELRDDLGLSIVLITHEMDAVRETADRVGHLQAGRLVESGPVAALLRDPASALGRALQPLRPHAAPAPGERVWTVTYASGAVPADWLLRLSEQLRARVSLLGASVEGSGGTGTGWAVVGLPAGAEEVLDALAGLGLHGAPQARPPQQPARSASGAAALAGGAR
ncbi:methionine ABC transporter ATP-binding protein [Kineococcus glutinatus]|uniref:ATP-binding cassette domain-containing protein n=1 Tax=Kineococcus glutinatus TaxID=1070872 RepID=A0ABP9H7M9_9ACTN